MILFRAIESKCKRRLDFWHAVHNTPNSKLHGVEALMREAEADLLRDRERNVQRVTTK